MTAIYSGPKTNSKPQEIVINTSESWVTWIGAVASIVTAVFTALAVAVYLYQYRLLTQQLTASDRNRTLESLVLSAAEVCSHPLKLVSAVERSRYRDTGDDGQLFQQEALSGKSTIKASYFIENEQVMQEAATVAISKLPELKTSLIRFGIFANSNDARLVQPIVDTLIDDIKYLERNDIRVHVHTPAVLAKVYKLGRNCLTIPDSLLRAARGNEPILPLLDVTVTTQ